MGGALWWWVSAWGWVAWDLGPETPGSSGARLAAEQCPALGEQQALPRLSGREDYMQNNAVSHQTCSCNSGPRRCQRHKFGREVLL